MQLRQYQQEAIDAVYRHLREREDNPCVVIPTGGGKTPVMSTICTDAATLWNGRVLVLAHVKELLQQTRDNLAHFAPKLDVGVYSAGLNRRDTEHSVIIAGIQSIYRRACDLGHFDLILIDEAHMIPPEGDGMYRRFIKDSLALNPRVRIVGLTATPFRMTSGMICTPEGYLNHICYEIGVKELINDGWLCPLKSKAGRDKADFDSLHIRGGEFIPGETENLMDADDLVKSACAEIVELTKDRKSVLIFSSGVSHGQHIQKILEEIHGADCGFVCAETPATERDELIARFRQSGQAGLFGGKGQLKYLCNVNVLCVGFDAPNIDCIALLRPTNSPGLYYQMVGRGFRLFPGKTDCLVLDFGGNVIRHGPVDQIKIEEQRSGSGEAPGKECPDCRALIHAGFAVCPECGHEFPRREKQRHEAKASSESILSHEPIITEHEVRSVCYALHRKKDAPPDHPPTMRVSYEIGWQSFISEWVCFEHTGYARRKAEAWWSERSNESCPATVEEAMQVANVGLLSEPTKITIERSCEQKFPRIISYTLGPKPLREPGADEDVVPEPAFHSEYDDDDLPF